MEKIVRPKNISKSSLKGERKTYKNSVFLTKCLAFLQGYNIYLFLSAIKAVDNFGTGNTVTVTNCTYGEKVVAG